MYAGGKFESQRALGLTVLFCCEGNQPEVFFWGSEGQIKREESFDSALQTVC